jgi:antitoxin HicB
MAVYKFYAMIEKEDGVFVVSFPDLENCFTDGETLPEAVEMAEDALGSLLSVMEDDGDHIPAPSKAEDIELPDGASLVLITVDTDDYREPVVTDEEAALMQEKDASVKITPLDDEDFRSEVVLTIYNNSIKDVFKEIAKVNKLEVVNFRTFIENALIHYIRSEQWQRAKHTFMTGDIEY